MGTLYPRPTVKSSLKVKLTSQYVVSALMTVYFISMSFLLLSLIGTGVFMAVQDNLRKLMIYLAGSNLSYSCDL